ncbi:MULTISPECIES: PLP-dependent aminotransferase family protein [Bradyrhizobium]|uniref:MocR-like pyridoxine biosynthesis transcription factor PdxR n=1 Tax=Bradyrhizobium TaxID=374 RepID=UPI0003FD7DC0|nr:MULTISPECIES: PLP-dependent aminotransferase family protein [Bradyrhizobium]QOG17722.1 aminotransferase class I/II-fold pyridoxal phosphate-dependent enzyme [Bradyrhizobium sp. SEMIA]UFW45704.1 PLP-dependent aminotransferase family protein [Bradyrhizobium arachidis]
MTKPLRLELDRSARTPLAEQIHNGIRAAIENGVLAPGARLPSWQDLAAQLGVARGTVRSAYEKLSSAQLIVAGRATGTHVADRLSFPVRQDKAPDPGSFMEMYRELTAGPAFFQMGVPGQAILPATLLARIRAQAVRVEMSAPAIYPDPRGELELRREIAAYLALARGIACAPSQIVITGGFSGGLGLALRVLGLEQEKVWMEDPGFPFTRHGLELARLSVVPIPVDADGIDVTYGLQHAPDAALAVVTPGQQAPLGSTLSLERRARLLDWAAQGKAWVIEDDYLSELQLKGRATPALASLDRAGRVIHIGSFSKTVTPTLRLGFVVAPTALASRFAEAAACLAPAPGPAVQLAMADFIREGHYLRHLRRTKRAYAAQADTLLKLLRARTANVALAGLAAVLRLPNGTSDLSIAREAASFGLAPTPLSLWYASEASARPGLLLGIATSPQKRIEASCEKLFEIIERQV